MLGAHPHGVAIPETQFLPECIDATIRREIGLNESEVEEWIRRHWRFRVWDLPPATTRLSSQENPMAVATVMRSLVCQWAETVGKATPAFWADHTPTHLKRGQTIFGLFPDARFVHLIRDGRGVAASVMSLPWGPCDPSSAAAFWARSLAHALAFECSCPESVLRVHYEDLVTNTEATLRGICDFAQIDFHRDMLEANGFRVPPPSRGQHQLIGKAADPSRASAWRNSLNRREVEVFESQCGDLLKGLGYQLEVPGPRPVTRWERLRFSLRDLFRRRLLFPIRRRLWH